MADEELVATVVRLERMANQRAAQLRDAGSLVPGIAMRRASLVALIGSLAMVRLAFGEQS